jgi:hypothetical protein
VTALPDRTKVMAVARCIVVLVNHLSSSKWRLRMGLQEKHRPANPELRERSMGCYRKIPGKVRE